MTREITSPPVENWNSFQARLERFDWQEKAWINFAYQMAKSAHKGISRLSGERYFEHLRGAALILLDECGIKDMSVICAALLHDSMEDTAIFGNPLKTGYSAWITEARWLISHVFSEKTAEIVISVTEPPIDEIEILDKAQAKSVKYQLLRDGSPEALLVKMADRLNNLRTFYPKEGEKTPEEKIKETEEILIPIFRRALDIYPKEARKLLDGIDIAIQELRRKYQIPIDKEENH